MNYLIHFAEPDSFTRAHWRKAPGANAQEAVRNTLHALKPGALERKARTERRLVAFTAVDTQENKHTNGLPVMLERFTLTLTPEA